MKVVSSKQMAEIESFAYQDGASESEFMQEAGTGVALVVHDYIERNDLSKHVVLLCAKGNNSGDAYVTGIDLLNFDYEVLALQTAPIDSCSPLCQYHFQRFLEAGGKVKEVMSEEDILLPLNGIIVDALFGTGFKGEVREPYLSIIRVVNKSHLPVISIDIPSGVNGETGEVKTEAIVAKETAFLGLPKTGFFLRDGWNHVGKLRYIDYGLDFTHISKVNSPLMMVTADKVAPLLPPLKRNRHKYEAGYVLGLAGSPGMPGAALLSSWSSLAGGAGIVRLMYPKGMEAELSNCPYEIIRTAYEEATPIIEELKRAKALFAGPGMGATPKSRALLEAVLPKLTIPCVLDADALNLYAEKPFKLPKQTVFTPHHGEMGRLLGKKMPESVTMKLLEECNHYAKKTKVTLVLKGAPTFIMDGGETIHVIPYGDPGMATAGCGDVLTGLITSLIAQGCTPGDGAQLGAFIHAWSGILAATLVTSYCMTASDIVDQFPRAFESLQ